LTNRIYEFKADYLYYDLNSYCGYFLLWFQSLLVKCEESGTFFENLPDYQKTFYSCDKTKIKIYVSSWKTKFNHFLEVFWNCEAFLSLIDQVCPLSTMVIDESDGLTFVVSKLAETFHQKIFFGIEQIVGVPFRKYKTNEKYEETIFLITKNG
jgi:hypothetical protein